MVYGHKINILIHCNLYVMTLDVTVTWLRAWPYRFVVAVQFYGRISYCLQLSLVNSVKYTSNNPVMCKSYLERHGHVNLIVTLPVCDLVRHGHMTLIVTLPVSGYDTAAYGLSSSPSTVLTAEIMHFTGIREATGDDRDLQLQLHRSRRCEYPPRRHHRPCIEEVLIHRRQFRLRQMVETATHRAGHTLDIVLVGSDRSDGISTLVQPLRFPITLSLRSTTDVQTSTGLLQCNNTAVEEFRSRSFPKVWRTVFSVPRRMPGVECQSTICRRRIRPY